MINAVVVAGEQQRVSAIHTHKAILPQAPTPARLAHDAEEGSLCYAYTCWLSILNTAVQTHTSECKLRRLLGCVQPPHLWTHQSRVPAASSKDSLLAFSFTKEYRRLPECLSKEITLSSAAPWSTLSSFSIGHSTYHEDKRREGAPSGLQEGAEVTLSNDTQALSAQLSLFMCITRALPSAGRDNEPLTQGAHLHPKHLISIKLLQERIK